MSATDTGVRRPTLSARLRQLVLGLLDALVVVGAALAGVTLTGAQWLLVVGIAIAAGVLLYRVYDFLVPKLTVDRLMLAEQEGILLQRLQLVEAWLAEWFTSGQARRKPRLKAGVNAQYGPISNEIGISPRLLADLSEEHLKIVVGHEVGHSERRWASMLAWSITAKLEEEMHADRHALRLAEATPAEWERAMAAVASLEESRSLDGDLGFEIRSKLLRKWHTSQKDSVALGT